MPTRSISPRELYEIQQSGSPIELIDVRTPAEFREVHASVAQLKPLDALKPDAVMSSRKLPGEPLYVICRTGGRSQKACNDFAAAGFGDLVVNVDGGTLAWIQAGLPVERGAPTMGLERQVRIAVGLLVVLGFGLGMTVNPWFHALSGFCGAGLIFAGITDICALGMLIARLPWNQR
jgi:rhodanese-related sulfurtransferase